MRIICLFFPIILLTVHCLSSKLFWVFLPLWNFIVSTEYSEKTPGILMWMLWTENKNVCTKCVPLTLSQYTLFLFRFSGSDTRPIFKSTFLFLSFKPNIPTSHHFESMITWNTGFFFLLSVHILESIFLIL